MGHVALYRRFRPADFDEIVEQKHAVVALRQAVISGQIAHAYLFSGTRGTGKTSIAKIFSRAVNCLSPRDGNPCNQCEICRGILDGTLLDVIEMDAASNNSVDNIRRICDEVMFLPSRARYKVYIIDEVHMLSGGAFNALLKTLEEPPAHAIFILATTEPHRIPATIISRCQRYDFRRIPTESMIERLSLICDTEGYAVDSEALATIASLSDGAMRDAISLLDQVATGRTGSVTRDDVLRITGVVDDEFLSNMAYALLSDDAVAMIRLTDQLLMDGRDLIRFTLDLARYFRDVLVVSLAPDKPWLVTATSDSIARMREVGAATDERTLTDAITRLSSLVSELKWSPEMRTSFEIALLSFGTSRRDAEGVNGSPTVSPSRQANAPLPKREIPVAEPARATPQAQTVPAAAPAPDVPVITTVSVSTPVTTPAKPTAAESVAAPVAPHIAPPVAAPVVTPVVTPVAAPVAAPVAHREPGSIEFDYMAPPPLDIVPGVAVISASPVPAPASDEMTPPPILPGQLSLFGGADDLDSPNKPDTQSDLDSPEVLASPDDRNAPPTDSDDAPDQALLEPATPDLSEPLPMAPASALPLRELWEVLLTRWTDSIFSDVLQLRNATVCREGKDLLIVFPDNASGYARSLTDRPEYKRIIKDIRTVIPDVTDIHVRTVSQMSPATSASSERAPDTQVSPAAHPWISEIISYAQEAGIPIEMPDEL